MAWARNIYALSRPVACVWRHMVHVQPQPLLLPVLAALHVFSPSATRVGACCCGGFVNCTVYRCSGSLCAGRCRLYAECRGSVRQAAPQDVQHE